MVRVAKTQKYQAVNIKVLLRKEDRPAPQRPQYMLRKKEGAAEATGPKFGFYRSPSMPDGTRGFSLGRGQPVTLMSADAPVFVMPGGGPGGLSDPGAAPSDTIPLVGPADAAS